jgi:hypothetical protein
MGCGAVPTAIFPSFGSPAESARFWRNTVSGAHALAVDFSHVHLVGEAVGRGVLVRLDDGHATTIRQFATEFPTGAILARGIPVAARGDTVHFVETDTWYRLRVGELMQPLNPPTSPGSC